MEKIVLTQGPHTTDEMVEDFAKIIAEYFYTLEKEVNV